MGPTVAGNQGFVNDCLYCLSFCISSFAPQSSYFGPIRFVLYCKPIVMFNAYFPIINMQLNTITMEFYFLWPKKSLDLDWTGPEPKLVYLRQAFF